jgi:hypothetical protein
LRPAPRRSSDGRQLADTPGRVRPCRAPSESQCPPGTAPPPRGLLHDLRAISPPPQVHRWVVLTHRAGLEPGENSNQRQQEQRPEREQSEDRAAYDEEGGDRESQGNNCHEGAKRAQSGLCRCSAFKRYDLAATQKSPVAGVVVADPARHLRRPRGRARLPRRGGSHGAPVDPTEVRAYFKENPAEAARPRR